MTDLVRLSPLESIALPYSLNGADGSNRSQESPRITAVNDLDAIDCWLAMFAGVHQSKHTYAAYRREVERLLLWSIKAKQKPLSSLDLNDICEYREFMRDPQPASVWIGRKRSQNHPDWTPFSGQLSCRSAKHADTIIKTLFTFLTDNHYLAHNPYAGLPKMRDDRKNGAIAVDRSLSVSQWQFILQFLADKQGGDQSADLLKWSRTQMIVLFLYATGLRIHELAKATLGDITCFEGKSGQQYWLKVIGKGQKYREVPIPGKTYLMIDAAYTKITGANIASSDKLMPLIVPLRSRKKGVYHLTPIAIHKILKEFFHLASIDLLATDPAGSAKLDMASTHWLRHTHGTHAANMDIPLATIRDNLGHSSISTTSQYVHADQDERHRAMDKLVSD